MKVFVHVATQFEASPIISFLNLERTRLPGLSHCYQNQGQGVLLWIGGIGRAATHKSMKNLFSRSEFDISNGRWINIGIAGVSDSRIAIGSIYNISQIIRNSAGENHEKTIPLSQPITTNFPQADLTTVDQPDSTELSNQGGNSEGAPTLLDMEAYHWATSLSRHEPTALFRMECYKVISDHADGQRIDFRELASLYDSSIKHLLERLHFNPSK